MSAQPFAQSRIELELPPTATTAALVSDYLRRVVHRGELGPGDRLPPERQLAVSLGVGRVTLREALEVLEAEGYLVRRRGAGGGAFLTDLAQPFAAWRARFGEDREALQEAFDVREGVEVQIARLAATRRTDADMAGIHAANEAMRAATTLADFRRCDVHFHAQLATASGSRRLAALMYGARGEMFTPVAPLTADDWGRIAFDGHEDVVQAVAGGDVDAAGEAMRAHVRTAHHDLLKSLEVR